MLAGQFAIILAGGTVLSYPVSVITQWGLWRIRRANGVDMLFPQHVHAPISLTSLATATVLTALLLAVSFLAVLSSAAFGKIRENLDPTPVIITVPQPRLLSGQSLVFLIAIACLCDLSGGSGQDFRRFGFCAVAFLVCSYVDAAPHPRCGEGSGQSHATVAAFQGLRLGFSCGLAAVLLVVFAVVGTCCVLRARN